MPPRYSLKREWTGDRLCKTLQAAIGMAMMAACHSGFRKTVL